MKKLLICLLCLCALLFSSLIFLTSCNNSSQSTPPEETVPNTAVNTEQPSDTIPETEAPTEAETEDPYPNALDPAALGSADITYACQDDSVLKMYKNRTEVELSGICDFYLKNGYEVYHSSVKNDNLYVSTLVKENALAHIYWIKESGEVNIVTSETAAATLPPVSPEIITGEDEVTVTQMKDAAHINGMGYVVRLPDGSFIIFDGSYTEQARHMLKFLEENSEDKNNILIRAWILTHSHDDHHPTFRAFSERYTDQVKIEYVIMAPVEERKAVSLGGDNYLNVGVHEDIAKFSGAKTVYAHTGMEFTFGNLKLEVLLAADDMFKNAKHGGNFNNSSLVTRLYDDNYSFLVTADIAKNGCERLMEIFGDYLQSNICQVSHHGVEDAPLAFYETVKASILYYPCDLSLYQQTTRHKDVRDAMEQKEYTKEILIAGLGQFTRTWGTSFSADAPLSMPNFPA